MKVAVTACSGRLGHATLAALCEQTNPADIIGIARAPEKIRCADIETRLADYESIDAMAAALAGVDCVVMISAPVTIGKDRVALHANVIAAAKRAGVRKLIFTSVIGNEVGQETMFYPTQKINRATEALVRQSGLEWIIARNGLYLDLDLMHIRKAAETGVYRNNGGEGRCGYITIAELGVALAHLALSNECNGRILNLTGESHTQAELIAIANEVFGIDVAYEAITAQQTIDKFMALPAYAARGEEVIRMLAGCFENIERGAFDVPSHFAEAAGRPALSTRQMMQALMESPQG